VAADVQQKMLDKTMARARRAGLDGIIRPLRCDAKGMGDLHDLDFALLCNSLHEVPDPASLLTEIFSLLKPGGRMLLMEPPAHLKAGQFEAELALAEAAGFSPAGQPEVIRQMCRLFAKPDAGTDA
jgi:SAM-dependent methyltransferase